MTDIGFSKTSSFGIQVALHNKEKIVGNKDVRAPVAVDDDEEEEEPVKIEPKKEPPRGTLEWIYYWSDVDGLLPSPINISITGAIQYKLPELKWYNYNVFPHKIKMTNTGYSVHVGAKWKTERPYLVGGPLLEKHVIGQIHFHWGSTLMDGAEHSVDGRKHPAEMHVTYFRSEYMTQEEAMKHEDGVVVMCYIIEYGVEPDPRLAKFIEGFPRVIPPLAFTRIGPYPMEQLMPMFSEDYFLYWGSLPTAKGSTYIVRWLVPRPAFFASLEQIKEFRKLWDAWDEPMNKGNFRPLQEVGDRHVFLINPRWNLYSSLLPIPRHFPEPSITILSAEYQANPWMLPPQNAYMLPQDEATVSDKKSHHDLPKSI